MNLPPHFSQSYFFKQNMRLLSTLEGAVTSLLQLGHLAMDILYTYSVSEYECIPEINKKITQASAKK
jgi:hypothetical protein